MACTLFGLILFVQVLLFSLFIPKDVGRESADTWQEQLYHPKYFRTRKWKVGVCYGLIQSGLATVMLTSSHMNASAWHVVYKSASELLFHHVPSKFEVTQQVVEPLRAAHYRSESIRCAHCPESLFAGQ